MLNSRVEWAGRITGVSPVLGALRLETSQLLYCHAIDTGETPHLSSHFFHSSRPRAHDHQVKVIPSAPEGEPAGWAVGLAVLVAAQSAQGHKAIVDTHVYFRLAPAPGAEYAHI